MNTTYSFAKLPASLPEQLILYYRWLRQHGINDSHSGNASVRDGKRVWVTPTGACADTLHPDDLLECQLDQPPPAGSSLDAALHLAVYANNSTANAVLHSHGAHTVAMTLNGKDFIPADFEGQLYFPLVPVINMDLKQYTQLSPQLVAEVLADYPITVIRGHGVYAQGNTLNQAYKWTCSLELSARTLYLAQRANTV